MDTRRTVLAIDQGTSSTRSILFDGDAIPLAQERREHAQHRPGPSRVEHDAEEIWGHVRETAGAVLARHEAGSVVAIGIAN